MRMALCPRSIVDIPQSPGIFPRGATILQALASRLGYPGSRDSAKMAVISRRSRALQDRRDRRSQNAEVQPQ